jgi:hypothetical protein
MAYFEILQCFACVQYTDALQYRTTHFIKNIFSTVQKSSYYTVVANAQAFGYSFIRSLASQ